MKLPAYVSESVKRLNPAVFAVAGIPDPERQSRERCEGQDCQLEAGSRGVGYRVTIVSVRKRTVDAHDNLRTGAKPLVDAITRSLGFHSDDDPRLVWEYGQVLGTRGGTIVKIEQIM